MISAYGMLALQVAVKAAAWLPQKVALTVLDLTSDLVFGREIECGYPDCERGTCACYPQR